jgi:hypothetical protein
METGLVRGSACASLVLSFALVLACETPPRAPSTSAPTAAPSAPTMPIPVIDTGEVIEPAHPTLDDVALDTPEDDEIAPSGAREIHPHGGMSDCLEMYSACAPDPDHAGTQRCTSAPLLLACGQTGDIPGGGSVVCVCP